MLGRWLVGLDGGAVGAEFEGLLSGVLELRAHVRGNEVAVFDPLEAVPLECGCVLSVQESAGDSASPEIDVAAPLIADRLLDRDVRDLDATAGT